VAGDRWRNVAVWTELMWLRVGTGGGMLRTAGFVKCGEYFDWLRNCQLLKKDCCEVLA
jgi:hypothetical protein